ncbi:MAG: hypothetical protein P9M03_05370, partial [Candidatus Theseobacter exili]|nr:hypothetical protein [Candidatus Theseobacter exili]
LKDKKKILLKIKFRSRMYSLSLNNKEYYVFGEKSPFTITRGMSFLYRWLYIAVKYDNHTEKLQ